MKIIEALDELKKEILLMKQLYCEPRKATISEATCIKLQERCRFFDKNKKDYFYPWRMNGKHTKKPKEFKNVRWGIEGNPEYYSPQDLACLECDRYNTCKGER